MAADRKLLDPLLTVDEVAKRLRVRKNWIYSHIYDDTLPFDYVKVGRYVRIHESVLDAYLAAQTKSRKRPMLREVK